jgi:predicted GTPase
VYISYVRIHNITAKAVLKFGSEIWVLNKRDKQRLEAAHIKFLRHLLGFTKLDKEKNTSIRKKTGARNIVKEIEQHQQKWLQHVQRMDKNRLLSRQTLHYRPNGQRNVGRPRKRWTDQIHLED